MEARFEALIEKLTLLAVGGFWIDIACALVIRSDPRPVPLYVSGWWTAYGLGWLIGASIAYLLNSKNFRQIGAFAICFCCVGTLPMWFILRAIATDNWHLNADAILIIAVASPATAWLIAKLPRLKL
jgi:hypothetical protein